MNFDTGLVIIDRRPRGTMTVRDLKIELTRIGISDLVPPAQDINMFKEYLETVRFNVSDDRAVEFRIYASLKTQMGNQAVMFAKLDRAITGGGKEMLGNINLVIRDGTITFKIINTKLCDADNIDYVELFQRAVDDYASKRRVHQDEIIKICGRILRRCGFNIGALWIIRTRPDDDVSNNWAQIFARFLATVTANGYNLRTFEFDLGDFKKRSAVIEKIDAAAREYVLGDIRILARRKHRISQNRYKLFPEILTALVEEDIIEIVGSSVRLRTQSSNGEKETSGGGERTGGD